MATSDLPGELEQTKRRQTGAAPTAPAPSSGGLPSARTAAAPVGVMLTPEQIKANSDKAAWDRSHQRTDAFKQDVGGLAAGILSAPIKGLAAAGAAGLNFARNTTFDSNLPDYSTPAKEAARPGPTPQQQAGGIAAFDMAQRAVDAGLKRPISGVMRPSAGLHTVEPLASVASGQAGRASGTASGGAPGGQPTPVSPEQSGGLPGWSRTGIGAGRAGGEIVGRMGADGVPEFSNREADMKGAGPQRAIGSVGDGIGGGLTTIRAQDPRIGMRIVHGSQSSQSSQSSPGGVRVTVVGGGDTRMEEAADRRRMSIAGLSPTQQQAALLAKAGQRLKADELGLRGAELRQRGIDAGLDRGLREREMAGAEQRTRLELEAGELSLAQQRQVADLYARYEQAAPEERGALAEQIRTLTGKEAPNRFTVVPGGQEYDAAANTVVNRPARVLNNQTGQFIEQSPAGGSTPQLQADQAQARRIIAADPSKRAEVERRFQEAYGRGLEG
ncbi:hypothetical protein E5198_00960 [Pseudomonas sp. A-1]|uniref:hypothetical protein n=1 Tax=Pseudomonas sp. A-1 TaxID=1821274 RepID=UPI0010A5C7BB|nr:hypothetical protein [Pseudomonas sp. A-1]THG87115.1 hypothetical protein E5198_00960 [Pseudomonas sp. A-1]